MPSSAKRLLQPMVVEIVERRLRSQLKRNAAAAVAGPLVVSGFLSEAKGVSQGARLSLAAFQAAGLAPVAHDIRQLFERGSGASELANARQRWRLVSSRQCARSDPSHWRSPFRGMA